MLKRCILLISESIIQTHSVAISPHKVLVFSMGAGVRTDVSQATSGKHVISRKSSKDGIPLRDLCRSAYLTIRMQVQVLHQRHSDWRGMVGVSCCDTVIDASHSERPSITSQNENGTPPSLRQFEWCLRYIAPQIWLRSLSEKEMSKEYVFFPQYLLHQAKGPPWYIWKFFCFFFTNCGPVMKSQALRRQAL